MNLPFRPKKRRLRTRFITAMGIMPVPLAVLFAASLFALNLATKLLGEVRFDHRVGVASDDELGELATTSPAQAGSAV